MSSKQFPISLKMKGTQRLLLKIKLLGIKSGNNDIIVGQGVVNIDSKMFENSLRVPIYDKNKGIEQVAICSIDLYVTGQNTQMRSFMYNKSHSKIHDSRDMSNAAVFSQMSYAILSESNESQKEQNQTYKQEVIKIDPQFNQVSSREKPNNADSHQKETNQDNEYQRFHPKKQEKNINSKEIMNQLQENEKILLTIKKYIQNQAIQSQSEQHQAQKFHKIKNHRKVLKFQSLSNHKYQNNFIKYHKNIDDKQVIILKNLQAIRIIQNHSRQSSEILRKDINKVIIYTVGDQKILSYNALGYRSYCYENGIKQGLLGIYIPYDQISLKIVVTIQEQGDFQGIIGIQQGQKMAIRLNKPFSGQSKQSYISREFKLYFDLKRITSIDYRVPSKNKNDYSLIKDDQQYVENVDLKERIQSLSLQPWGYQSNLIKKQDKKQPQKLTNIKLQYNQVESDKKVIKFPVSQSKLQQSSQIQQSNKKAPEQSSRKSNKKIKKYVSSQQSQIQSQDQHHHKKNFIKRKNLLKKPFKNDSEIEDINNIRNGNRNNYQFNFNKNQIKEVWRNLLFKKKIDQQNQMKRQYELKRKSDIQKASYKVKNLSSSFQSSQGSYGNKNNTSLKKSRILESIKTRNLQNKSQKRNFVQNQSYPSGSFSLQINNISISLSKSWIEENNQAESKKFIKISIKNHQEFNTQVFNDEQFESILLRLSNCFFKNLIGNEKLSIQVYSLSYDQMDLIGQTEIRLQKLLFLRNNHIYNGKIYYEDNKSGDFSISFNIFKDSPAQRTENQDYNSDIQFKKQRKNESQRKRYGSMNKQKMNNERLMSSFVNNYDLLNTMKKNVNSNLIRSRFHRQMKKTDKNEDKNKYYLAKDEQISLLQED